jgi:hypothetical protein
VRVHGCIVVPPWWWVLAGQVAGQSGTVVDTSLDGTLVKVKFPRVVPMLWLPVCCGDLSLPRPGLVPNGVYVCRAWAWPHP